MRELRLKAYRFSISWPRIMPSGRGAAEQRGIDFYARLLDLLHDAGITPVPTLYHWDLPQALEDMGGWANRDIAGWFADFADLVARKLGDRMPMISTFNEPAIFLVLGYLTGRHAPGHSDPAKYFPACHHVNLAHGLAVQAIRAAARDAKVGTVLQLGPFHPREDREEDHLAARRLDGLMNRWYAEPVTVGTYPADMLELFGGLVPIGDGDMEIVRQPLDFVGMNLYSRTMAYYDKEVPLLEAMVDEDHRIPGRAYTDMGWEVYPESMFETLARFKTEWGDPEVYITENGAAYDDGVVNGGVSDNRRIEYLKLYLEQVRRAMDEGVKVRGYFVWSLFDNFEWALGYGKRFGIVHVDYETLRRTPKASAFWYRQLIENGSYEM